MASRTFDPKKIEDIFSLVALIKDLVRNGDITDAMTSLIKVLTLYQKTPMLKKEREVLEEDFYNLLQKMSEHPDFTSSYGPVTFRKGEHAQNVDFMKQLLTFGDDGLQEKMNQGMALLEGGQKEEAYKVFIEIMDEPEASMKYFFSIGDAYLLKKMWKEAQDVFTRAVDKDPESINALNRMAISFRKDKKYDEALATYRKAVKMSPEDENLYYNVARLFLDMGKTENAGQALQKALKLNPKFERAAKLLTGVYETLAVERERAGRET